MVIHQRPSQYFRPCRCQKQREPGKKKLAVFTVAEKEGPVDGTGDEVMKGSGGV